MAGAGHGGARVPGRARTRLRSQPGKEGRALASRETDKKRDSTHSLMLMRMTMTMHTGWLAGWWGRGHGGEGGGGRWWPPSLPACLSVQGPLTRSKEVGSKPPINHTHSPTGRQTNQATDRESTDTHRDSMTDSMTTDSRGRRRRSPASRPLTGRQAGRPGYLTVHGTTGREGGREGAGSSRFRGGRGPARSIDGG